MESTAAARLPPVLAAYHAAWPQVRIELVTGTSAALAAKVRDYELEAAFVAEPFPAEGLASTEAFAETLVLISPRAWPEIADARALADHTVIAFASGCSYRRILESWLGREGVAPGKVMEFASYHAIVACVAAGTGVAIVPRPCWMCWAGRPRCGCATCRASTEPRAPGWCGGSMTTRRRCRRCAINWRPEASGGRATAMLRAPKTRGHVARAFLLDACVLIRSDSRRPASPPTG